MSRLIALVLCVANVPTEGAEISQRGPFEVVVEKLNEDIYVVRRPIPWRRPVQANVTFVINEEDVVVFDGGGFPAHAEAVVSEIRKLTDKPVSTILMSHWHGDHNLGYAAYRRVWPRVRIIAHEKTRSNMTRGVMDYVAEERSIDISEEIAYYHQRIEETRAASGPESLVDFYRYFARDTAAVVGEYQRAEVIQADETFRNRLVLHRRDRTLELLWLGNANTDGDAILWLPMERIVVVGDIVVGPTPYGFGSYPTEWADTLRAIQALDYAVLVPGHGDVQRDHAYVDVLTRLLDDVMLRAHAAVADGADDEEELSAAIDLSAHDDAVAGDDPFLAYLFDVWFKKPIMESAFIEASGGAVRQPTTEQ